MSESVSSVAARLGGDGGVLASTVRSVTAARYVSLMSVDRNSCGTALAASESWQSRGLHDCMKFVAHMIA